jgi:hypothetical protein
MGSEIEHDSMTNTQPSRLLMLWIAVSALAIIHLIIFDVVLVNTPLMLQVQYTPDDGYYYLTLARNFVRFGEWTFDGGTSLTSGFHLMQAYLLVGLYQLFQPDAAAYVRLSIGFGAALTTLTALTAWGLGVRKRDTYWLMVLTVLITAKSFLLNSVSITEWPLVILIAGLYCLAVYARPAPAQTRSILFALGLLGSLARSDFGLLPLCIFISALFQEGAAKDKGLTQAALAGLIGALLGVGLVLGHSYLTTGEWVQSSALMKSHWAKYGQQKIYTTFALNFDTVGMDFGFADFKRSLFLLGWLMLSGPLLLILLIKKSGQEAAPLPSFKITAGQPPHEQILVGAAALCLIGYGIFYTSNGAAQHWYTANLLWPVFILCLAGARYLAPRILQEAHFTYWWLSIFTLLAFVVQLTGLYPLSAQTSPWPHQQFMLEAGQYLAQQPLDSKVGAWNSGIIGYYQGGTGIVNVDGLVNNDVYPYVITNRLPDYLRAQRIRYLVDFDNMFNPPFTLRGGYADANFLKRLVPLKTFDQGQYIEFKYLRLYQIEP